MFDIQRGQLVERIPTRAGVGPFYVHEKYKARGEEELVIIRNDVAYIGRRGGRGARVARVSRSAPIMEPTRDLDSGKRRQAKVQAGSATRAPGWGCFQFERNGSGDIWLDRGPRWYLSGTVRDDLRQAVLNGSNAWNSTVNPCGYADQNNFVWNYSGVVWGYASTFDNVNVVDSGNPNEPGKCDPPTEPGFVTIACQFVLARSVVDFGCNCYRTLEFGITFNSGLAFYGGIGEGPLGSFDLWSVASHEFGHALGLGHVWQSRELTMDPYHNAFGTTGGDAQPYNGRDLGAGDVCGLRDLYPAGSGC